MSQKVASEYIAYMMLELTVDKVKGTEIYVIESMLSKQALIIIPSQDLEAIMHHRQSRGSGRRMIFGMAAVNSAFAMPQYVNLMIVLRVP
jgi:hypothetical protein